MPSTQLHAVRVRSDQAAVEAALGLEPRSLQYEPLESTAPIWTALRAMLERSPSSAEPAKAEAVGDVRKK